MSCNSRKRKKRKRGLGKGGAAAKYCTMSVAARMAQFPDEPFEERLDLLNQPMMWCLACGKLMKSGNVLIRFLCAFVFLRQALFVH